MLIRCWVIWSVMMVSLSFLSVGSEDLVYSSFISLPKQLRNHLWVRTHALFIMFDSPTSQLMGSLWRRHCVKIHLPCGLDPTECLSGLVLIVLLGEEEGKEEVAAMAVAVAVAAVVASWTRVRNLGPETRDKRGLLSG